MNKWRHLLVVCVLLAFGQQALSRTFFVASPEDTTKVTSLRGAIIQANRRGLYNTIVLTGTNYQLTIRGTSEDAAYTGDLDVVRGVLRIVGKGSNVVIDASRLGDRVFHVLPRATLILENVIITGGQASGGTNGFLGANGSSGGGLHNSGTLVLYDCVLSNNYSGAGGHSTSCFGTAGNGGHGGGIFNRGRAFMNRCTVVGNSTGTGGTGGHCMGNVGSFSQGGNGGAGAGIFNAGVMMLNECAVEANLCGGGGPLYGKGGDGGGVYNTGNLILSACLVRSNSAGAGEAANGGGGDGGGIFNAGHLTLYNCVIASNTGGSGGAAPDSFSPGGGHGGNGGGIYNSHIAKLLNCSIAQNIAGSGAPGNSRVSSGSGSYGTGGGAGGSGGGIFNVGDITVTRCTIWGNSSGWGGIGGLGHGYLPGGAGGPGGNGGGIYNAGFLSLQVCTISGNVCGWGDDGGLGFSGGNGGDGGSGGGIYSIGKMEIVACTVSRNVCGAGGAGGYGFGYSYYDPKSPLGGRGGNGGSGGGLFNGTNASFASLCSTLVACNLTGTNGFGAFSLGSTAVTIGQPTPTPPRAPDGDHGIGPDLFGQYTSRKHNLIGVGDGSTGFTNSLYNDIVGTGLSPIDPLIGPLQDNGGPTLTHALLAGSPAIDRGWHCGFSTDQRGRRRPHDFASIPNAPDGEGTDIGAFELDTPILGMRKLANEIVLFWDSSFVGYVVEFMADWSSTGNWRVVTGTPAISCGYNLLTDKCDNACKFYRLRKR